jgi:hypothetical protein
MTHYVAILASKLSKLLFRIVFCCACFAMASSATICMMSDGDTLCEEIVAQLDARHAPCEILGHLANAEATALKLLQPAGQFTTPLYAVMMYPGTRHAVIEFVLHLSKTCQLADMQRSVFFDASTLIDVYIIQARNLCSSQQQFETYQVSNLATICAAAVLLIAKREDYIDNKELIDIFAKKASAFSSHVCSDHVHVTREDIIKHEFEILRVVGWNINIPSVHTFLYVFCNRIDVLSRGILKESADWALNEAMLWAYVMIIYCPSSTTMSPSRMAKGLFCISIVAANLVPLAAMRPSNVSPAEWMELFMRGLFHETYDKYLTNCAMHTAQTLKVMTTITGHSLEDLQFMTHAVLDVASRLAVAHHHSV